ncbi:MAG: NAD(P)-binding protein [Gammaproteobacteria bacterium]|nr:NAD(P)-binding protein [Gammaproteobacteria bacterium]
MAASSKDVNTRLTFRRFKDDDSKYRSLGEDIFNEDHSHKCPTYVHRTPPCQGSCPSGQDIRGWLDIVRGIEKPPEDISMQEYAFRRSTDANPFPSMMGRVCPAPCEEGCNRRQVEEFVGINSVEQYIGDSAKTSGFSFDNSADMSGKNIAIVGGGPAGLAAAYQLRRKGHASVIFDDHEELGGMFKYGIPGYRTPRTFLNHEIQRILDMGGIEVKLNTRVGQDVSMESIENDYDAVIWAIGCKTGRPIPVKNAEAPNCVSGVDFLEAFNKGDMQVTAKHVVCVGGGDTSIDVVSVARRLGAAATLTSLFARNEMTASEHEVQDALREGVNIQDGVMPLEVIHGDDGRAIGLKMCQCNMVDDRPEPVEGTEYVIDCDLIVSAIGQTGDLEGLESLDNGKGLIDADAFFRVPGHEGHFVAGDIVRPHLLTTAIGHASICADSIDSYLSDKAFIKRPKVDVHHFSLPNKLHESALAPDEFTHDGDERGTDSSNYAIHNFEDRSDKEIISSDRLFLGHFEYTERLKRDDNVPDTEHVLGHFEDRIVPLSEEQAITEASRCMSCGMCFECDNCVIYCPQDAVFRVRKDKKTMGRYVDTDYSRCIGCHICADVCPTGYIDMAMGDH